MITELNIDKDCMSTWVYMNFPITLSRGPLLLVREIAKDLEMNRVFVLDDNKQSLGMCKPARARQLLDNNKAAVYRYNPFTIILNYVIELDDQDPISIKLDPGGTTTGIAMVGHFPKQGNVLLFAGEITHQSKAIVKRLKDRRGFRSGRRSRKTRYRAARFDNRKRVAGWLPPSIESRVDNIVHFVEKFKNLTSGTKICDIELGKFDTQKMDDSEISKSRYSEGSLKNFSSKKEYLIHRDGNCCAYCGATNVKLQKEHVVPNGIGSNSVRNLVLSCAVCNRNKSNRKITEFLSHDAMKLNDIVSRTKVSLWGAAALNSMRNRLVLDINALGMDTFCYAGYETLYNREKQGYPKEHWVDAACVGDKECFVHIPENMVPLKIKAIGRGSRRVMNNDKFGFIKKNKSGQDVRKLAEFKEVKGFRTGDFVKLERDGCEYYGRVTIKSTKPFLVKYNKPSLTYVNKIWEYRNETEASYEKFKIIQRSDGYSYH
jgi:hypothetical protein